MTEQYRDFRRTFRPQRWWLHISLFVATAITTLMAGVFFAGGNPLELAEWWKGLEYAILIMTFISAHEFGHFFAARYHGVDVTLPYYLPMPLIFPFGTWGAIIRTRSEVRSRKALFDIGVAGPLAGFVVAVAFLAWGFTHLPPESYLYSIHPEYVSLGGIPSYGMYFGDTLLWNVMRDFLTSPMDFIPPMNEVYHYPFLCVGWFGVFVTSLNLLPMGQLDGGHIAAAVLGERGQRILGNIVWWAIVVMGLGGASEFVYSLIQIQRPDALYTILREIFLVPLDAIATHIPWYFDLWAGWLFWAVFTRWFSRIAHPPVEDPEQPGTGRVMVAVVAALIFVVTLSWNGLYEVPQNARSMQPVVKKKHEVITLHSTPPSTEEAP